MYPTPSPQQLAAQQLNAQKGQQQSLPLQKQQGTGQPHQVSAYQPTLAPPVHQQQTQTSNVPVQSTVTNPNTPTSASTIVYPAQQVPQGTKIQQQQQEKAQQQPEKKNSNATSTAAATTGTKTSTSTSTNDAKSGTASSGWTKSTPTSAAAGGGGVGGGGAKEKPEAEKVVDVEVEEPKYNFTFTFKTKVRNQIFHYYSTSCINY